MYICTTPSRLHVFQTNRIKSKLLRSVSKHLGTVTAWIQLYGMLGIIAGTAYYDETASSSDVLPSPNPEPGKNKSKGTRTAQSL